MSSRNWPSIEEQLDVATQKVRLCLELNEESISAAVGIYISDQVDRLARLKKYNDKTRIIVQEHLSSNADNTFLWVALVCQDLKKVKLNSKVPTRLRAFPHGLDSLYQQMMHQIQNSEDADLSKQIIAIVSTVYRPITIMELASFIENPEDIFDDLESLEKIIGFCASFLTLRGCTISLVHQSAKDFVLNEVLNEAYREIFPSGIENIHHTHLLAISASHVQNTTTRYLWP